MTTVRKAGSEPAHGTPSSHAISGANDCAAAWLNAFAAKIMQVSDTIPRTLARLSKLYTLCEVKGCESSLVDCQKNQASKLAMSSSINGTSELAKRALEPPHCTPPLPRISRATEYAAEVPKEAPIDKCGRASMPCKFMSSNSFKHYLAYFSFIDFGAPAAHAKPYFFVALTARIHCLISFRASSQTGR